MKYISIVALTALASALVINYVHEAEALPSMWKGVVCAKDYMVRMVKEKVISRSTLVQHYNETMTEVKRRYDEAKLNGELEGKDEAERENFYYKIAVEELRKLKERIEAGSIVEKNSGFDSESEKSLDECIDPDAMVKDWNPDDGLDDEDDEAELLAELDDLEMQARMEQEMGWSMTEEARAALRTRTKEVLVDLLNNEVRQIAMAVLSAYLSGGSLLPVVMSFSGVVKGKVADYLMNSILDLVSYALGRPVEIRPAPSQIAAAA